MLSKTSNSSRPCSQKSATAFPFVHPEKHKLLSLFLLSAAIISCLAAGSAGLLADEKPKLQSSNTKPALKEAPLPTKPTDDKGWIQLFNGKDLDGWKVTDFGGEGEVFVENGEVVISQGAALSGVHTEKKLPKINYEIQYEAQRTAGSDFFAGLTFPVNDTFCSLILGGWGGGLCGLSSLDGMDASENQTTSYQQFEKGKWYKVRLLVTEEKIRAWLDGKEIVDVDVKDHRISVRFEVERSQPLGFSTWQTTGRIRNARIRPVKFVPSAR